MKADWNLTSKDLGPVQQAYHYAHEQGTRFVVITNGDHYCLYDRSRGYTYTEHLVGEFDLTDLGPEGITILMGLEKDAIDRFPFGRSQDQER